MDINKAKQYQKDKILKQEEKKIYEKNKVLADLKNLHELWQEYNLEKVYLYGSFIDNSFYDLSDIDIAIEPALDVQSLFILMGKINYKFDRKLDLRNLIELSFMETIKKNGEIVYERKNNNIKK